MKQGGGAEMSDLSSPATSSQYIAVTGHPGLRATTTVVQVISGFEIKDPLGDATH